MEDSNGLRYGHKTVEWLLFNYYSLHMSIQTLKRELSVCFVTYFYVNSQSCFFQFIAIEHFTSNQLSFLCRSQQDDTFYATIEEHLEPAHLALIRRFKSVTKYVLKLFKVYLKRQLTSYHIVSWASSKRRTTNLLGIWSGE